MTDKEIEKTLKVKSQGLFYKNRDHKSVNLDEYDEKQFLGCVLDYINRLKANLDSAIKSFTKMETLYKVKCNELECAKEKTRKDTAKEILGDLLAHCNLEIKDSYEQSVKGSKHYGGVNNAYHQVKRIIEHYMERYGIGAKE